MSKEKFRKRKERKRLIRAEMVKRGILSKEIAARLGISEPAVSQGCATSPRIVAEIIAAGVPARLFGESRGQESRGQGPGVRGQEGQQESSG